MHITVEQLDNDIKQTEQTLEQVKAQVNQITGALAVLRNVKAHLEKPEEVKDEVKQDISPENAAIQSRDEAAIASQSEAFDKLVKDAEAESEELNANR
jgi:hypothetical protein